jgi:hypothetical protein
VLIGVKFKQRDRTLFKPTRGSGLGFQAKDDKSTTESQNLTRGTRGLIFVACVDGYESKNASLVMISVTIPSVFDTNSVKIIFPV